MSECKHEFTMIDLRGHWHCSKCGIVEIVYLRARAEAAEKERDELKAENERLKAENLAMRNCQNCADYNEYPHLRPFHCHSCFKSELWNAVKNG